MTQEIETRAWDCSGWVETNIGDQVEQAMEVAERCDMSTEQVLAYAIMIERERCAKYLKDKAEMLYVDYNDKAAMYLLEDTAGELLNPDP